MNAKQLGIILLAVGVLSACGGSGSTGATSSTVAKSAITASNQSTITNSAISAATQSLGASTLSNVGGVQTTSTPTSDHVLSDLANSAFNNIANHQNTALTVSGAITTVTPNPCTTSGNITFDTDGSNVAPVTPYTYFTISYNNCVAGGITQNGTVSLSNLNITGTAPNITAISATFAFNYTISNATTSAGIYGGFTIAATGINTTTRVDSISGTSLNFKYGSKFETMTNFAFTSTYDNTVLSHGYSDTVDYTFASDVILAGFDFKTINPLVRNVGDVKPRSGQVIITGANNSKLRVTVLPYDASTNPSAGTMSGKVTLELDQGTGLGYGSAVTKTWTQLANNT